MQVKTKKKNIYNIMKHKNKTNIMCREILTKYFR